MLVAAAVGVATIHLLGPLVYRLGPGCLLYQTTGYYCAGCGGTRCLVALAHGHVLEALSHNAMAVGLVPFYLLWALDLLICGFTNRHPFRIPFPVWAVVLLIVAVFAYSILRNLPWYPFTLLAP